MKLAINYSTAAADLFKTGQINFDFFKCPDWSWMIEEANGFRPVAVHFDLTAGDGKASQIDWEHVRQCLELTNTPYLNLHLESRLKDFPGVAPDTINQKHASEIYDLALRDIEQVVNHIPAERIILENVPYSGLDGKILRPSVEPELITRILQSAGCGFLFDLSHARISAHYIGMPEMEYIEQLPMHRMQEMHFTGMEWINGRLRDHLDANENDWRSLDWVFSNISSKKFPEPWLLAFEYGGVGEKFEWRSNPEVIAAQIPRLAASCQDLSIPLTAQNQSRPAAG